jgi:5-methylcytosine-specific restriction endonuclease McrA
MKGLNELSFDCGHVIAEALGGKTTLENLRPICSKCNKSMRTTHMDEFKKQFFQ